MRTFRSQVVIWIAAVVAIALSAFGAVSAVANIGQIQANLDRELRDRGHRMSRDEHGPPGSGFGFPGQRGPDGPEGLGMPPNGQPGRFRPDTNDEAGIIWEIRRPRWATAEGKPTGGFDGEDLFDVSAALRASKGLAGFSNATYRGEAVRVFTVPVILDGSITGIVQVAHEVRDLAALRAVQVRTLVFALPLGLFAALLVALLLAGRVVRPIKEMGMAAQAIAGGDYSARIPAQRLSEFADLGDQFNQMAGKVEGSVAGLQSALAQQRQFTADASHELRTPLTRLQLATSAGLSASPEEAREALQVADQAGRDMARLVHQLLELAQADAGNLSTGFLPVDLRVIAADASAKVTSGKAPIELKLPDEPVIVMGNADQLQRVCLNLLENSRGHTRKGSILLTVAIAGQVAILSVADSGEGIPPEHLPHVTERFYRAEASRSRDGGGAGLGLAIVHELVAAHGGSMAIESKVNQGTTVTITIPIFAERQDS
jgi:two-component system OmpR family sensor kinase